MLPVKPHPLIELIPLHLPRLPAVLDGLRIAHLTDLHVSRPRPRFRALVEAVDQLDADLIFLTGDYMSDPGNEPAAMAVLESICEKLHPRLGTFGVFGNHDTHAMRKLASKLPVQWLSNEMHIVDEGLIEVHGFENERYKWPDTLKHLAAAEAERNRWNRIAPPPPASSSTSVPAPVPAAAPAAVPIRLLLSHYPNLLPVASDLGMDLVFSGHTHGGQWRLPKRLALYTSCDLPGHLSAGVLRYRQTLGVVSRGLGETFIPLRILCPPHLPVFELHRGPLPETKADAIENLRPW